MSRKETVKAFILRKVNYGERDVITTLLTPDSGRVQAMAKNGRNSKRFGGGLEPFRKIDAIITKRKNNAPATFHEMRIVKAYHGILSDYEKITLRRLVRREFIWAGFENRRGAMEVPGQGGCSSLVVCFCCERRFVFR